MKPYDEMAAKLALASGISYWESVALTVLALAGERFAGSGSGAVSDACWSLERKGILKVVYRAGQPYHVLTEGPAIDAPESPTPDEQT